MKLGQIEIVSGPNIHGWLSLILFTYWSLSIRSWWPIGLFVGGCLLIGLTASLVVLRMNRNTPWRKS